MCVCAHAHVCVCACVRVLEYDEKNPQPKGNAAAGVAADDVILTSTVFNSANWLIVDQPITLQ